MEQHLNTEDKGYLWGRVNFHYGEGMRLPTTIKKNKRNKQKKINETKCVVGWYGKRKMTGEIKYTLKSTWKCNDITSKMCYIEDFHLGALLIHTFSTRLPPGFEQS